MLWESGDSWAEDLKILKMEYAKKCGFILRSKPLLSKCRA